MAEPATITIYSDQPHVALLWGDDTVTVCRDDLVWARSAEGQPWVPNELQRTLMVTRLRYIAQVLEDAGKDPG